MNICQILFLQRVADLYDTFKRHDAQQTDRLLRYRNIEAESAKLLSQFIRMQQAKSILEMELQQVTLLYGLLRLLKLLMEK